MLVKIGDHKISLSNLDKIFWPKENISKGDLIKYYLEMADYILPHLHNRPFVMKRYPDGIWGEAFYQKQCPGHTPEWIKTILIDNRKMILCNDAATLIWLVNLGCIELHHWLSQVPNLSKPDIIVFDLDPEPPAQFKHTLEVAMIIKKFFALVNINCFPKTSGSEGLHIYIPIKPQFPYTMIKRTLKILCTQMEKTFSHLITTERTKTKRKGKVYLDYLQNGYGKTMASVYSIRPVPGARVSTPLTWQEIENGIDMNDFTIFNLKQRLEIYGDLFLPIYTQRQDFTPLIDLINKMPDLKY
ncbi:MAG: DNA polymerase domain-containing protein [Clostridia bacterium]|nr:DNA polymerase domain-containing protein [Clostridia bacterium]